MRIIRLPRPLVSGIIFLTLVTVATAARWREITPEEFAQSEPVVDPDFGAEAFYRQREAKGHGFNTIMRALADKGIRIRWRCGQDDVAYDEMKYLKSLRTKGSTLGPEGLEL